MKRYDEFTAPDSNHHASLQQKQIATPRKSWVASISGDVENMPREIKDALRELINKAAAYFEKLEQEKSK